MNPILKNILAVIAGLIIGSAVNMAIVRIFEFIIPPPEGVDVSNMESIKASMHLYTPVHFISPFLAHAAGTFVGAFLAVKYAAGHHMKLALIVGIIFLALGSIMATMIPAPTWFIVLDLGVAYIPMCLLGARMAVKRN